MNRDMIYLSFASIATMQLIRVQSGTCKVERGKWNVESGKCKVQSARCKAQGFGMIIS